MKNAAAWVVLSLALAAAPARATTYSLTISTTGPISPSSVVTSTPSGIVCPGACVASFAAGSVVTIGETSASTVAFAGWVAPTGCSSNARACAFTMVENSTITAKFDPTLTISIHGNGIGSVVNSTAGINCGSIGACAGGAAIVIPLAQGTTVELTASTGTASAFVGWTGNGGCSTASTCTLTLDGSEVIVATFTASGTVGVSSFTIAVVVPRAGGTVRSTPPGISCPGTCSAAFVAGGSVAFATAASAGYRFSGWAHGGCSGLTACVVTSSTPLQGLGGSFSPAAYFYRSSGGAP